MAEASLHFLHPGGGSDSSLNRGCVSEIRRDPISRPCWFGAYLSRISQPLNPARRPLRNGSGQRSARGLIQQLPVSLKGAVAPAV